MEHRNRKRWSIINRGEQEAQRKKKSRIETEAKEMKENSKKWVLNNQLKIGRRMKLPGGGSKKLDMISLLIRMIAFINQF